MGREARPGVLHTYVRTHALALPSALAAPRRPLLSQGAPTPRPTHACRQARVRACTQPCSHAACHAAMQSRTQPCSHAATRAAMQPRSHARTPCSHAVTHAWAACTHVGRLGHAPLEQDLWGHVRAARAGMDGVWGRGLGPKTRHAMEATLLHVTQPIKAALSGQLWLLSSSTIEWPHPMATSHGHFSSWCLYGTTVMKQHPQRP
jgi:hypothetical protein